MATKNRSAELPTVPIQVSVKLYDSPQGEKPPQTAAYAFNANGRFLTTTALDKEGKGTLRVPAGKAAQDVRVVVGPALGEKEVKFADLSRRGAQQQFVRLSSDSKELRTNFEIPAEIWVCWIRFCFVQGTLIKRILSAGVAVDYPVCGAQVQIWEVEPFFLILSKLTDIQLQRINEYLLNPQPLPPGPPPPDPGPLALTRLGQMEVARPVSIAQTFSVDSAEHQRLRKMALMGSLTSLRQALTQVDEEFLRFIICLLFPQLVTTTLVDTVTTDRCGNFQDFIILGCYDTVNLYFTASIDFLWLSTPIYNPTPVSCYTYWNYQCGTNVTLYTDSIFAPLCAPCPPVDAPENYVLIRALGNAQLNGIYGTGTLLTGSTTFTEPDSTLHSGGWSCQGWSSTVRSAQTT